MRDVAFRVWGNIGAILRVMLGLCWGYIGVMLGSCIDVDKMGAPSVSWQGFWLVSRC